MRLPLVMAGLVLICAVAAANDDKKYESKGGRYKVVFPGAPELTTTKVDEIELNVASVALKGGGFLVIYSDLSAEKIKNAKPKELIQASEAGLVGSFKAKITDSKEVEFGKEKYPARQISGEAFLAEEGIKIQVRMTIILAENRLYQVFVFGPKDLPVGEEAKKFFESFEIVK